MANYGVFQLSTKVEPTQNEEPSPKIACVVGSGPLPQKRPRQVSKPGKCWEGFL